MSSKRKRSNPVWGMRRNVGFEGLDEAEAREILAKHTKLVRHVIKKYNYRLEVSHFDEDLVAVGQIALLRSYQSWDASRSAFSTWAVRCVRQALSDFCRRARGQTLSEQSAMLDLKAYQKGRRDHLDARSKMLAERAHRNRRLVRLDAPVAGDDTSALIEFLPAPEEDAVDRMFWSRAVRWLRMRLANGLLTDRERAVVYGRLAHKTLREIGQDLGVTRERIRQLEARAFDKLKRQAQQDRL